MDMLANGVHSTEVHRLLLSEYFEGLNTTIAGDPSSALAAVPKPNAFPAVKKLKAECWLWWDVA